MNILVIEDDDDCLRFIREALGPLVEKFIETKFLGEAMAIIDFHEIGLDAVWLDLSLADSSAENTLEAIPRLRKKLPNTALIVVSGFEETFRTRCLQAGADAFANKRELCGFNQKCIAALFITASVTAMQRGIEAQKILERVTNFFAHLSNSPKEKETA